jgi:hypothetical protein
VLCAAVLAFGTAGAASAATMAARSPAGTNDRVGQICQLVLGLPAGPYTPYDACRESLSQSLAEAPQAGRAQDDAAMPGARRATSYFYASNAEVHRREGSACAEIGYDPASVGFAQCVANLQSDLSEADHPLQ